MPIYEYKCRKCGKVTEKIEGSRDRALAKCPACGGRVERLMSPGAFILKGTGWYASDYAGKGNGGRDGGKRKRPEGEAPCPASADGPASACAGCPKAK